MAELKPCPFCGGIPKMQEYKRKWAVECRNDCCGVLLETSYLDSAEEAIEVWNTRADDRKENR